VEKGPDRLRRSDPEGAIGRVKAEKGGKSGIHAPDKAEKGPVRGEVKAIAEVHPTRVLPCRDPKRLIGRVTGNASRRDERVVWQGVEQGNPIGPVAIHSVNDVGVEVNGKVIPAIHCPIEQEHRTRRERVIDSAVAPTQNVFRADEAGI
jgi:hypothetical protein